MQSSLKLAARAPRAWQVLAIAFSASALLLGLRGKPAQVAVQAAKQVAPKTSGRQQPNGSRAALERVSALREDGSGAALESLIAIAERGEPKLLSAALEGIAQIGGDRAREFLARRFDAATDAALAELASALATLGDAKARALLQNAARSTRPAARSAAFDALTTLDTADVREFMLQALTFADPSPAAGYFSNCREPRALPALERLARSGDDTQRRAAIDALYAQGASTEPALLRLLREDDQLCDAMLEGRPPTAFARRALRRASIERLRAGALTSGSVFQFLQGDLSRDAREALVQAARDPASSESALDALSTRGDGSSLRALSALSDDADRGLSQRAACALLSRPDSRSRPFLSRPNRGNLTDQVGQALERINAPGARPI